MRISILPCLLILSRHLSKSGELPDIIQEMIDRERDDDKKFLAASRKIIRKVQKQRETQHLPQLVDRKVIEADDGLDDTD